MQSNQLLILVACSVLHVMAPLSLGQSDSESMERQITHASCGQILTNTGVWSHDGKWIVYDVRSDSAGDMFDGSRIERVHSETGQVQVLFESQQAAHCGVATCSPTREQIVFIHGPEKPDVDWQYSAFHRRGVFVDTNQPNAAANLDARNLVAPVYGGSPTWWHARAYI